MMSTNDVVAALRGARRGGGRDGPGRGAEDAAPGAVRTRPDPVRAVAVLAVALWLTSYLRNDRYWSLLDDVDLAIHETGHVVFAPFGEFLGVAGGSLFQVLVPLAFVLYFAWRRDAFASFLVLFWVSQSLFNVAVYVADARAQLLPLVGGDYAIHDWSWMLSRLHVLRKDEVIAGAVRGVAASLWIAAALGGLLCARKRLPADRDGPG